MAAEVALGAHESDGIRSRGRAGLEDLYTLHAPEAARLAYLLTGDTHLAEDLVQEAFVRLTGRFEHIRDKDAFPAYLRRTVVNLSRGYFRRKAVERNFLRRQKPGVAEALMPDVEGRSALMRALDSLPQRQRAAVVLRHYTDLSERQVAELLDCSVGNVKSLTSRGLASLRARLQGEST